MASGRLYLLIVLSGLILCTKFSSVLAVEHTAEKNKSRLIILADMGNEPDEEQQMVHMLMCSNEFDLEGLIAVTGKYLRPESKQPYRRVVHPELFTKLINEYAKVLDNLKLHASGWHEPEYLHSIVAAGQSGYGIGDVGKGKSSAGSKLLIKAFKKENPRPIWIVVNAGSNTLAQALVDFRSSHGENETNRIISKLRVFENGAQDNAGAWICCEFPQIHWIRSNYQTYAYGGPGGMDGDVSTTLGPNFWKPFENSVEGQNDWLKKHVMKNHGPLGAVYPERRHNFMHGKESLGFMEGGGTIPWMGLVNKGLFDINHPNWGGWGGRFSATKVPCFWSRHGDIRVDEEKTAPFYVHREVNDVWRNPDDGKIYSGDYVPVWRWRKAMYNDFKCRMDWCLQPYKKANHHPVAVLNGNRSDDILRLRACPGQMMTLDASASFDPDKDRLEIRWWQYLEAGSYPGHVHIPEPDSQNITIKIPTGAAGKQIHIILEVNDINSIGSLYDYRRIVIDVEQIYDHNRLFRQKS